MTIKLLIAFAVMFAALGGIYNYWQKKNSYYTVHIAFLSIIIISCTVFVLYYTNIVGSYAYKRLYSDELIFSNSRGFAMGRYLAGKFPGGKALVIAGEDYKKNKMETGLIEELEKGFGPQIKLIAVESLDIIQKYLPYEQVKPINQIMKAVDFDIVIDRHPECNIIVSLIGLPDDVKYMKIWQMEEKKRPKVAVLNGYLFMLGGAIKVGYVCAAAAQKNGSITDEAPPSNPEKAFNMRYILVTPENIDEMAKKYKKLFLLE